MARCGAKAIQHRTLANNSTNRSSLGYRLAPQARNLKQYGELPDTVKVNENETAYGEESGDDVLFEEDEIDDI